MKTNLGLPTEQPTSKDSREVLNGGQSNLLKSARDVLKLQYQRMIRQCNSNANFQRFTGRCEGRALGRKNPASEWSCKACTSSLLPRGLKVRKVAKSESSVSTLIRLGGRAGSRRFDPLPRYQNLKPSVLCTSSWKINARKT